MNYTPTEIKAIFLDMDGTLIDTESLYKKNWQESAKALGFILNDASYAELIGIPFSICLKKVEKLLPPKIVTFREGRG